ncbi:MAG: aminotransferase class I/II-fold pyridoxal phosphate-dependent enzyme [Phascolarctobacterium sp.]|uniref:aminotransferase class I/II-fold pyridoxal phosphate-dependent enzyme n=1 Tax=Phascolarctobacterium sp. TaxID=2049039 RepID=UPI0026DD94DF|nr:aminotransferase class I/II-fold pyridoxal phosphate-dependent enzyme [Phascolarctobacterium sp.]MDO4921812.1 aminotransferase class I/II-fold pyridoxal phosphate-dependent enzyme [Phascolarctobacterium sp.]
MNFCKDDAGMPLLNAMLRYKYENVYPLHTPGHKGGRGMERLLRQELGGGAAMDVSLMSELDDIHEPASYIKDAQALAAKTYGSDACFWALNGTTQAIHAMLMTALQPGEKLLLPRNAHRSVAGGLILGGVEAVYLQPEFNAAFGLQMQVTPEAVERALIEDKAIKAVLLTTPNYYGVAARTAEIAAICHAHGAVLLVDEAHGPHLGFSDLLPPSALQSGADACAQSTHKILGAMTQCSMLHVRGERLDLQRAADVMSVLTTTSPNYLLMASLDAARAQAQAYGKQMAEAAVAAAQKLRRLCAAHAGLRVLEEADCGGLRLDHTKVTVNFADWGYNGVEVGDALRQAGVAVELVDARNVLFLVTYADTTADYEAALRRIDEALRALERQKRRPLSGAAAQSVPATAAALTLREVFYSAKQAVPLAQAAGRVCGEQVSFYPPGIPVLLPGEIVTPEIISYCRAMKALGLPVSGPADSSLQTLRVVRE